jgi:hypothetical protein
MIKQDRNMRRASSSPFWPTRRCHEAVSRIPSSVPSTRRSSCSSVYGVLRSVDRPRWQIPIVEFEHFWFRLATHESSSSGEGAQAQFSVSLLCSKLSVAPEYQLVQSSDLVICDGIEHVGHLGLRVDFVNLCCFAQRLPEQRYIHTK